MNQITVPRFGYMPSLDSLRAFAVFAVVAAHIGIPHLQGGVIGVDVFFVLSGFLITTLLLEEQSRSGRIDLGAFYQRRALRLFPALAVLIPVVVIVAQLAPTVDPHTKQLTMGGVAWVVFYAANWARATGTQLGLFGHTWSLAVEEQFYLIWPTVILALVGRRRRYRRALATAIVVIAVVVVWRSVWWLAGAGIDRVNNGSDMRADALLIGCAVALAPYAGLRLRVGVIPLIGAVAFLGWVVLTQDQRTGFLYLGGFTAVAVAAGVVLVALNQSPNALAVAPVVWLGRISYGIYLWHYPIVLVTPLRWSLEVRTLFIIGATLVAASLSWFVIERRFLAMRRRSAAVVLSSGVVPAP